MGLQSLGDRIAAREIADANYNSAWNDAIIVATNALKTHRTDDRCTVTLRDAAAIVRDLLRR